MLKHRVRPGNLCATHVLDRKSKDRVLDMLVKPHPHLHRKAAAFLDRIRWKTALILNQKSKHLGPLISVFQGRRIHLKRCDPAFLADCLLCGCLLLRCLLIFRPLTDEQPLVEIDHLFWYATRNDLSMIEQQYPVAVFTDAVQIVADK